jgi:hypothetical protein
MILAFYSSMAIILDGAEVWNENPVLMTVDTFDKTLQSIDFPAITFCTSSEYQPDNWDLTEHVFNSFEFNCEFGNDNCNQVRKDFKPVMRIIYDLLLFKLNDSESIEKAIGSLPYITESEIKHLYWAMTENKLSLSMVDDVII